MGVPRASGKGNLMPWFRWQVQSPTFALVLQMQLYSLPWRGIVPPNPPPRLAPGREPEVDRGFRGELWRRHGNIINKIL